MDPRSTSDAQQDPVRAIAWRGVVPAFLTTTVGMLPGFLLAASAVQIREDVGLSLTGLGILIGVFFGLFAVRRFQTFGILVRQVASSRPNFDVSGQSTGRIDNPALSRDHGRFLRRRGRHEGFIVRGGYRFGRQWGRRD